jgi:hypothetical protein
MDELNMANTEIPLASSTYNRSVAKEARTLMRNRFFESNPILNPTGTSSIARPALKLLVNIDPNERVRGLYYAAGVFGDAAFTVIGSKLYKVFENGTYVDLGIVSSLTGSVTFAAVANIGTNPEKLFIADGGALYCYVEAGYARGTLTLTGAVIAADQVRIGAVYYAFTAGSVNAGAPAGTAGNPWLVALGGSAAAALTNLYSAINRTGIAGTAYSTALTKHPLAQAAFVSTTVLKVVALDAGVSGDAIVTTETGANMAWGAGTLTAGGTAGIFQVPTPDEVGMISVVTINSYVICVPAQGEEVNGRFYWIQPGEITIDALDFATAERSPDPILQALVYSDMFWLCGLATTEPWVFTGDPAAPVQRFSGILFDRGTWEGTAVQVKDSLILTDPDGAVFQIKGGLKRISTPAIEERIRKAIQTEQLLVP